MCYLNKECKTEKAIASRIQKECLAYIKENRLSQSTVAEILGIGIFDIEYFLENNCYWGIEKAMRIASALNFNLSMTIYYPNSHIPRGL
jgi:predicted XRE-type DNA-binding protein